MRVDNDPLSIAAAVAEAGPNPEVVIEATYGWYWIVDLVAGAGRDGASGEPVGVELGQRRVKNDERDATDLIDMLRLGRLPEAWIAPPATRELRELVRYRAKLVALRSGLKAQVHAVMAKEGVLPTVADMFGQAGNAQLDQMELGDAYTIRVESLRDLIELYDREVAMLEAQIRSRLRGHRGYRAIQAINGIGPTMAAILVAEIGDVSRFRSAPALCSWAGLTPKHDESDTTVRRGGVTKQGSRLVRWAVIEGTVRYHGGGKLAADYRAIAERRGKNKATVAIARKVLTLVYYGLRDGEIRCLAPTRHEQLGHDRTRARNRHDPRTAARSTNCLSPSGRGRNAPRRHRSAKECPAAEPALVRSTNHGAEPDNPPPHTTRRCNAPARNDNDTTTSANHVDTAPLLQECRSGADAKRGADRSRPLALRSTVPFGRVKRHRSMRPQLTRATRNAQH